jgi:hypothetical protein
MPGSGSGVKGYIWDSKDLAKILEERVIESFSTWQRQFVIPATKFAAPIYQGPDPREQYHPKGLLKQYLGQVQATTKSGRTYLTCGIPGATGMGQATDPDRAWIITQVLHRGWVMPKARTKPMQFPVLRSELRNPEVEVPPPKGMPEDSSVAWIYITFARPQERITLNKFHIRAFDNTTTNFLTIFRSRMNGDEISKETRKIKFKVMN